MWAYSQIQMCIFHTRLEEYMIVIQCTFDQIQLIAVHGPLAECALKQHFGVPMKSKALEMANRVAWTEPYTTDSTSCRRSTEGGLVIQLKYQ